MLPYVFRKALFFFFVGVFLISAPLVVLYTAGYRFNRGNNSVSQTGTLAIASTPRGGTVEINLETAKGTTPTVLQRLSTGTRSVHIAKKGYHDWERTVTVTSGTTTYITAPLFLQTSATILTPKSINAEKALALKNKEEPALPATLSFTQTETGIEVRASELLLTLLPSETYSPLLLSENNLFLQNNRGEFFFVSLTNPQAPHLIGKDLVTFAWNTRAQLFAWTDGSEVHIFSPVTTMQELITRQSDPISSLSFAHDGESIVIASSQNILGIDLTSYNDGRMQTLLTTFTEPTEVWFTEDGSTAFLQTQTTLSSLLVAP